MAIALGVLVSVITFPADAFTGNVYLTKCTCNTTADFAQAAKSQAQYIDQNGSTSPAGTYVSTSTSHSRTAYMLITGQYTIKNKEIGPVWVTSTVIPVDANGNSLAALSESSLQATYSAIDQSVMGTNRDFPIILGPVQQGQSQSNIPDYFTSTDADVWVGVVLDQGGAWLGEVNPGDTVTITWQYTVKGTVTATFQVITDKNGHLTLKWQKATQNGKPINRDGSSKAMPVDFVQAGAPFSLSGFGAGAGWIWLFNGLGNGPGVQITVDPNPFGGAGGAQFVQFF